MFKITNEQLIQIAAVDAGMDPFAEYCTKGVYAQQGLKVRRGEKPVLTLELWCPRTRKDSVTEEAQEGESSVKTFFQFKMCHLFSREQTDAPAKDDESERLAQQAAVLRIYHTYHQHNSKTGFLEIVHGAPEVARIAAEWIGTSKVGGNKFPVDFVQAEKELKAQKPEFVAQGELFMAI